MKVLGGETQPGTPLSPCAANGSRTEGMGPPVARCQERHLSLMMMFFCVYVTREGTHPSSVDDRYVLNFVSGVSSVKIAAGLECCKFHSRLAKAGPQLPALACMEA
jgi:hypothetical protein